MSEEKTYRQLIEEHPLFLGDDEDVNETDYEVEIVDEIPSDHNASFGFNFDCGFHDTGHKKTVQFFRMYFCEIPSQENILHNLVFDEEFFSVFFDIGIESEILNIVFDRLSDLSELQKQLCSRILHLDSEEDCKLVYETVLSYHELCGNVYTSLEELHHE